MFNHSIHGHPWLERATSTSVAIPASQTGTSPPNRSCSRNVVAYRRRGVRLLLVSDLHYVLPQFDWVVEAAPDYDVVVIAGDSLDVSSSVPLDAQSVVVLRYAELVGARTRVVISSGNHDLTGPDAQGEQCALWLDEARVRHIATDGDSVLVGDTLITVCPWWDGPIGRESVDALLRRDAERRRARWVWVYHWPPVGSGTSWTGKRSYGDPDVLAWIDELRPDIVLTGHVHQSPFKPDGRWVDRIGDTWVFNAGNQIGKTPAHIDIDIDVDIDDGAATATWISMLGLEHQDLTAPVAAERTVF
jgi:Icc-related predicted phosphoesterase